MCGLLRVDCACITGAVTRQLQFSPLAEHHSERVVQVYTHIIVSPMAARVFIKNGALSRSCQVPERIDFRHVADEVLRHLVGVRICNIIATIKTRPNGRERKEPPPSPRVTFWPS